MTEFGLTFAIATTSSGVCDAVDAPTRLFIAARVADERCASTYDRTVIRISRNRAVREEERHRRDMTELNL